MNFRLIKNLVIGLSALGVIGSLFAFNHTSARATSLVPPAYASIVFGRSAWVGTTNCVPYPNSVNLGTALSWLYSQGISASGGVVTGFTNETTQDCVGGSIAYPSWNDLAQLQSLYGFEPMSESATHTQWPEATTPSAINAESCDTLSTFKAHGFTQAWGMFYYPGNKFTSAQESIVSTCFGFGRKYSKKPNTQASATVYPYLLNTLSVNGGNCNNVTLACYSAAIPGATGHYELPSTISTILSPSQGQYALVQFYRFVTGSNSSGSVTWDCSGADPTSHWSNRVEVYCYNDFQTAVSGHATGITFTNPAVVATAWNRVPAGN